MSGSRPRTCAGMLRGPALLAAGCDLALLSGTPSWLAAEVLHTRVRAASRGRFLRPRESAPAKRLRMAPRRRSWAVSLNDLEEAKHVLFRPRLLCAIFPRFAH